MASLQTLRERYVGDSIATASPARLLTMLCDRLCLDLELAHGALAAGDLATTSARLIHAQDITLELRSSLDPALWAGGEGLAQVYAFLFTRLIDANVAKDAAIIEDCRRIAEPLRSTWHEAAALHAASQPLATTA